MKTRRVRSTRCSWQRRGAGGEQSQLELRSHQTSSPFRSDAIYLAAAATTPIFHTTVHCTLYIVHLYTSYTTKSDILPTHLLRRLMPDDPERRDTCSASMPALEGVSAPSAPALVSDAEPGTGVGGGSGGTEGVPGSIPPAGGVTTLPLLPALP